MKLKIRKANSQDIKFFYKIRNDKLSIKNSINSDVIKYSDHAKWFHNKIKNLQNKVFVIYKDSISKERISYVRFEKYNLFYKVSLAIHKKYRKKNLSLYVLNLAEQKFKKNALLLAEVKNTNIASYKLFKNSNYCVLKKLKNLTIFVKILNKDKQISNYLKIIDQIESIRKVNNINWMNILRIAINHAPQETSKVFKKISFSDNYINKLSKQLTK